MMVLGLMQPDSPRDGAGPASTSAGQAEFSDVGITAPRTRQGKLSAELNTEFQSPATGGMAKGGSEPGYTATRTGAGDASIREIRFFMRRRSLTGPRCCC